MRQKRTNATQKTIVPALFVSHYPKRAFLNESPRLAWGSLGHYEACFNVSQGIRLWTGSGEESHNACVGELQTQHHRQYHRPTRSAWRPSSDAGNKLGIAYMLVNIEDRSCYQGWVSRWARVNKLANQACISSYIFSVTCSTVRTLSSLVQKPDTSPTSFVLIMSTSTANHTSACYR
jgi:hypothetical protein